MEEEVSLCVMIGEILLKSFINIWVIHRRKNIQLIELIITVIMNQIIVGGLPEKSKPTIEDPQNPKDK